MQFACLFIDRLPIKAELHRTPSLVGRPLIIAHGNGSQRIVLDASQQARGVHIGMQLSEALSQCKGALLIEPDPVHYRQIFDHVLDAIETLGADVEDEDLGHASIQLSGLELLHGGEDQLIHALVALVPSFLTPRIGIGPSKFVASVAAYQASPGHPHRASTDLRAFLDPLPVDLLPVPWRTIAKLRAFGLQSLGQLARSPIGALQSQFGREGKLLGELARGIDHRPLIPRRHQETATASLTFADPTSTLGIVRTAVESLLIQVFAQQSMRGRFARVCTLDGTVFRAPPWHRRMVFKGSLGDHTKALSVVRQALENNPPPGPLEDLHLTLSTLTGEGGRQESLFRDVRREENLREALRQLRERLGTQPPIYHVREVEPWSRLPERRQALVPFSP